MCSAPVWQVEEVCSPVALMRPESGSDQTQTHRYTVYRCWLRASEMHLLHGRSGSGLCPVLTCLSNKKYFFTDEKQPFFIDLDRTEQIDAVRNE